MKSKYFNISIQNEVCKITFTGSKKLNALNSKFIMELSDALKNIEKKTDLKVIIFSGEGKAFIAGADIKEMVNLTPKEALKFSYNGQNLMNRIEDINKITIAAIDGFTLGGGLEFALSCDIRIATSNSKFGFPEVGLGLIPGFGGTYRLEKVSGLSVSKKMILTGDMINAEEALKYNIIHSNVSAEELEVEIEKYVKSIINKGPNALSSYKRISVDNKERDSRLLKEREEFSKLFSTDGIEGMKAFIEKREPKWN